MPTRDHRSLPQKSPGRKAGRASILPRHWLPVAALLPLAAIGAAQMLRASPSRRLDGVVPSPADPGFRKAMQAMLGTPFDTDSKLQLLQNGNEVFSAMWRDLGNAEHSIAVHSFFWSQGKVSEHLLRILEGRARAGVRIRVLYDWIGALGHPRSAFDALEAAGGEVACLRPASSRSWHAVHHRSHARYVLVDDHVAYTGGFGFADEWSGSGRREGEWRDTAVRVEGPLSLILGSGFRALWAEATGSLIAGVPDASSGGPHSTPAGAADPPGDPVSASERSGVEAIALQSSPTSISSPVERLFTVSISAARHRLYLAIAYFAPNRFFRSLLSDAARRGVDVRILTANRRSDLPAVWWAGRARYEDLLRSGVRIFEYQPAMMHAKTVVADGRWSVVGAANLDNQSMTNLDESMVGVLDEGFGEEMESVFREDLRWSKEIRLEAFRRRPVQDRARETLASAAWRVL